MPLSISIYVSIEHYITTPNSIDQMHQQSLQLLMSSSGTWDGVSRRIKGEATEDEQRRISLDEENCAALPDLQLCLESHLLASQQTCPARCRHCRKHVHCALQVLLCMRI